MIPKSSREEEKEILDEKPFFKRKIPNWHSIDSDLKLNMIMFVFIFPKASFI